VEIQAPQILSDSSDARTEPRRIITRNLKTCLV